MSVNLIQLSDKIGLPPLDAGKPSLDPGCTNRSRGVALLCGTEAKGASLSAMPTMPGPWRAKVESLLLHPLG